MLKQISNLFMRHPADALMATLSGGAGGALIGMGIWIAIVSIVKKD